VGKSPSRQKIARMILMFRKGEVVHYDHEATLKEIRTVNLGYKGGSRGVSFRVMKGVYYRVGAHRGHVVKEERLVPTSAGILVVTNKRIILQPAPGYKPVSIPLKKVLSYSCYNNGIEVFKEGREKGYFFSVKDSGAVEIFGICLSFLLTPDNDPAPAASSKSKSSHQPASESVTPLEHSAPASGPTDLVSLFERAELLGRDANQLLAYAGYNFSSSGDLEGDGDPQKFDEVRACVLSDLSQMEATGDAILHSLEGLQVNQASIPRLQALLGKAGIDVCNDGEVNVHFFNHIGALNQAEKDEVRAILSGTQTEQRASNALSPVIDVSSATSCKFCGERNSLKAKFCHNCGRRIEN